MGSRARAQLVYDAVSAEPCATSATEWLVEQHRLAAAVVPSPAFGTPLLDLDGDAMQRLFYPGREAVLLAVAEVAAEATRLAASDAAMRSVAALTQARALARSTADAEEERSASGQAAGATAYDKAVYAAARCVGRWAELREQEAQEAADVAAAQERLEGARVAAAEAGAYVASLQREQRRGQRRR